MFYWGTVEKTREVISRSFKGQTVKDHKKDVFLFSYRIPEFISGLHHFFQKVRQNTRVIE